MATYKIRDPQTGKSVSLSGDSPPTEQELNQIFSAVHSQAPAPTFSDIPNSAPGTAASIAQKVGRATAETLIPPTSASGFMQTMNPIPGARGISRGLETLGQNVTRAVDIAAPNTPRTLRFLNSIRPGELTPSSAAQQIGTGALTEGAIAAAAPVFGPVAGKIGRGIGNAFQRISGTVYKTPGVLEAAFNDPSLFTAPGTKEVGAAYKAAKAAAGGTAGLVGTEESPALVANRKIIGEALKRAQAGSLKPAEAQAARMAVDDLGQSGAYADDSIRNLRKFFDNIAKSDEGLKAADTAYSRGVKADALREIAPLNKGGGTSIAKLVLGTGVGKFMGPVGRVADVLMLSPLAQGIAATGAGIVKRGLVNQGGAQILGDALREAMARRKKIK